ncbi:MAG: hypothetical protein HZB44_03220 [Actinobacteria bacterium]|nr:hypothetical protein [Actinomycetota bacterium]
MSRLTIIGVTALIILLVGASAVLAQGNTPFGGGMMGGSGGTYGPGMMGGTGSGTHGPGMMNGTDGNGMMGNGTHMTTENRDRMRDAMNTGNWDEMANICRDTATTATR